MERFGEEVLVPLAGIFCLFGLPVLAFVFFRLLAHRERIEMIRSGLAPAEPHPREARRRPAPHMHAGIPPGGEASHESERADALVCLRKGITLTFIGFAITLGLSFIGFHDDGDMSWHPGPWLLGGLIPMFVGLAQVVTALLSGATLHPARYAQPGVPPFAGETDGSAPPPQSPPTYDTSYTYRPGSTRELRPPVQPPERR